MLVGLVSNTLGRAEPLAVAAELLTRRGAELILHGGDVGGRHVLDALAAYDAAFIWGDRDTDRMGLLRHANNLKLICYGMLASQEIAGKQVCLYHGDDLKLVKRLLAEQQYDYLLMGHSKEPEDYKNDKTRVLSPGSILDPVRRSVVLLNLETDEAEVLIPAFT